MLFLTASGIDVGGQLSARTESGNGVLAVLRTEAPSNLVGTGNVGVRPFGGRSDALVRREL